MRLSQLTGLRQEELHNEYKELEEKIAYYNEILTNDELCRKVIKDELIEVKEMYSDDRKTEIMPSAEEFNAEDFYADDEVVVTISHMGYIKRTNLSEFRAQGRGGIGSKGSSTRDNDFIEHIYTGTMHNTMMFFTGRGRCYWLKVYDIPEGSKGNKGRAIQNMLQIEPGDSVEACLLIRKLQDAEFCANHFVVFATEQGIVKKTCLKDYSRVRANGVNAINIRENDRVIAVNLTNGSDEIIVANRNGRAVRFNEDNVRVMGRVSAGVQSIVLDNDPEDKVIGMAVITDPENESILVMSDKGWGKYTSVEAYRKTSRHAKGVKAMNLTDNSKLVTLQVVKEEDDLMIINKSGNAIRLHIDSLKETKNRATQGTKVIELKKRNDSISHVCVVPRSDDEEETPQEETQESENNGAQE